MRQSDSRTLEMAATGQNKRGAGGAHGEDETRNRRWGRFSKDLCIFLKSYKC